MIYIICCDELKMSSHFTYFFLFFFLKVVNEDTTAITKTWANARLQGPDSVLTMLRLDLVRSYARLQGINARSKVQTMNLLC